MTRSGRMYEIFTSDRFEGTGAELLHDPKVIDLYLGGTARIDAVPS